MNETIIRAKRWSRDGKDIRFYIETTDENGVVHNYTRYVSGNAYHAPKSWGMDCGAEGEPSAEVIRNYKSLTFGGRESFFAPKPSERYEPDEEELDMAERLPSQKPHALTADDLNLLAEWASKLP